MAVDGPGQNHPGIGRLHNDLSGSARSAAQVHTVYGGVHMHGAAPSSVAKRASGTQDVRIRLAVGVALTAIATSVTALVLVVQRGPIFSERSLTTSQSVGTPESAPAAPFYPVDTHIPKSLNAGRQRYEIQVPELVSIYAFQVYSCNGRVYQRAAIGGLQVPKASADMPRLARIYSDKLVHAIWADDDVRYGKPMKVVRSSYDGATTYYGVEVDGEFEQANYGKCDLGRGVVKTQVIDHGDSYLIVVVSATLSSDPGHADGPTETDIQYLLDSIVPTE